MWNNRRRQDELLAKLDEQNAMLAQMHSTVGDILRKVDEQKSDQEHLQSEWTEHVATLQGQVKQIEKLEEHAAKQQLQIEALKDVIRGLEHGIKDGDAWRDLPPDDSFWQKAHEPQRPFVVPFMPAMQLMLWIGHARFPTLPLTSIILPRTYANRAFVRIPKSEGGEPQHVTVLETDVDKMPDGYIALLLDGYAAPPTWINALLAFKAKEDLNMWLVWFDEDEADPSNAGIRVAVAYSKRDFHSEPIMPAEWSEKQAIYFERHPSQRMTIRIPRTPVIAEDSPGDEPASDPSQETPAS